MSDFITIVAGFPRSGSTMMMRMLHAGGLGVVAENFQSFEDHRCTYIGPKDRWLEQVVGKAIKVLDLHRMYLPEGIKYKVIWMKRDYEQQAKSQIYFLKHVVRVPAKDKDWKKLYKSYPADEQQFIDKMAARNIEYKICLFEEVISDPYGQSLKLLYFLNNGVDAYKMSNIVKVRHPKWSGNLNEELTQKL